MRDADVKHLTKLTVWILKVLVGPRLAGQLSQTIDKWLITNGTLWTVARLKAYWTAAKQLRAGNHDVVTAIYQENWIAYRKDTLIPRGPFGTVVQGFVTAQRPAVVRRWAATLRVYTSLSLRSTTLEQYNKAKLDITSHSAVLPANMASANAMIVEWLERNRTWIGPITLQRPDLRRLKAFSAYHNTVGYCNEHLVGLPYGKLALSLITEPYIPESLKELNPLEELRSVLMYVVNDALDQNDDAYTLGTINFLQEGGAKCRVVASPNAWTQWLFEPLHRALDDLVSRLPNSAVHDQNKGAWFIQECIERNTRMYCFDLSAATDRFPLQLQKVVLAHLGLAPYAEALEEATWEWQPSSDHFAGGGLWHYAVGQPMGLYGSFPLFHLAHYILLSSLAERIGPNTDINSTKSFLVLGDDVVITDPRLADSYQKVMMALGVNLSTTKSVISSRVGEFAGFVGVKTNKGVSVFRPYKFPRGEGLTNMIQLLNTAGSHVRQISPQWEYKYSLYQTTIGRRNPDLSPLIRTDDKRRYKNEVPMLDHHRLYQLFTQVINPEAEFIESSRYSELLLDSGDTLEELCPVFLGQEHGEVCDDIKDRKIDFPEKPSTSEIEHNHKVAFSQDPLIRESVSIELRKIQGRTLAEIRHEIKELKSRGETLLVETKKRDVDPKA